MSEIPDRSLFALVAYVPDPLASFLYQMRRSSSEAPCPQPHVTILPPRPLRVPAESACRAADAILHSQNQFEVQLSSVNYFADTNTLYLDISDGVSELHALHDSLNHGDLYHQEQFAFLPHLTVAGPVNPSHFPAVQQQVEDDWRASSFSPRFVLSEIVCLIQQNGNTKDNWQRFWSIKLSGGASSTAAKSAATTSPTART